MEFPVWEFALDEEAEDGQDEATVRPYPLAGILDCGSGMFIVRARFDLADGTIMTGYLSPPPASRDSTPVSVHPVITAATGQVGFWCGIIAPDAGSLEQHYRSLDKAASTEVFPLKFQSDVPLSSGEVRGQLAGFLVVEDMKTMRTRTVK